jgi:hypothetical protein
VEESELSKNATVNLQSLFANREVSVLPVFLGLNKYLLHGISEVHSTTCRIKLRVFSWSF